MQPENHTASYKNYSRLLCVAVSCRQHVELIEREDPKVPSGGGSGLQRRSAPKTQETLEWSGLHTLYYYTQLQLDTHGFVPIGKHIINLQKRNAARCYSITLRLQLLLMSLRLNICLYVFWGQGLPTERPSFSCLDLVECN